MPHDVFISYSSIDRAAAFAACATFEAAKIRCWIAPRDVAAGAEWAEEIINAIEAATVMVLIFSANSNESRQVKREIELAVSRGLTIMPLRLEQIEPTKSMAYYMAGVHWIDAVSPPLEQHFRKMVEWIKPVLRRGPPPEPPPKTKAEPKAAPRQDPPATPALKQRRKSSSILGDIMFEFFGVGAKQGGVRINDAGKAITAARALADAGKYDEAIAGYRSLIARIEDANVPNLDWSLSLALLNLATTYRAAGRREEALNAYRDVARICGDIADEMVEKQVAAAMNNHANLLMEMGRPSQAVPIQDDVVGRFRDTINTDLAEQVAIARLNRGLAYGKMNRHEEAVAAFDELVALTNLRVWPKFDEYVARGLVNKGVRLGVLKRPEQELAAYDDALSRLASTRGDVGRERTAALAMRNKVVTLRDSNRRLDAIAMADKMLAQFGSSGDADIAEHVAVVRKIRSTL